MSSGVVADDIDESVEEGGTEEGEDDGVGSGEEVTDGNSDEATDDIDDDDAGGSSLLVDAEDGLQGREREINNRLQWKYYTCGCLRFGPGTRRRP